MTIGVVLMTYGAPSGDDDLPRYLAAVRGGKTPSDELVAEFARRYEVIGGSPLIAITRRQAAALERELGAGFAVRAGMRYSEPSIAAAVRELVDLGASRLIGLCLSPQWSDLLMGGYERALREAAPSGVDVRMVHAWHREPRFISAVAERIRESIAAMGQEGARIAILLTAHSLPKRVVDAEPAYVAQLRETADLVAEAANLAPGRWQWAYQSAGHTAEEWLRPDLIELFPPLAAAGHRAVLIAPIQFLSDHLEVLYDLDIAAAAQAREAGLDYRRVEMANTQPAFIRALASIVAGASSIDSAAQTTRPVPA